MGRTPPPVGIREYGNTEHLLVIAYFKLFVSSSPSDFKRIGLLFAYEKHLFYVCLWCEIHKPTLSSKDLIS